MLSKEDVLAQALALPAADLEYVADMLERRISAGLPYSPEIGELWSNEINRGETTARDFEKSLKHMPQALAEHRSSKASQ